MLPILLIIGFFVWLQRRAQGQMGNVMSIGRSRAKPYDADKPSTTFADIAGYEGVKQEITEVVDFLIIEAYPEPAAENCDRRGCCASFPYRVLDVERRLDIARVGHAVTDDRRLERDDRLTFVQGSRDFRGNVQVAGRGRIHHLRA